MFTESYSHAVEDPVFLQALVSGVVGVDVVVELFHVPGSVLLHFLVVGVLLLHKLYTTNTTMKLRVMVMLMVIMMIIMMVVVVVILMVMMVEC